MSDAAPDTPTSFSEPEHAVLEAIQKLMAARLGRAFVPLVLLFVWGIVALGLGGSVWIGAGAVVTAGAVLSYGLRIVQMALGREHRPWMSLAMIASVIPPLYALFLVGWVGLRSFALGFRLLTWLPGILGVALGVWVLRSWMQVVEIERLARIMRFGADGHGGGD